MKKVNKRRLEQLIEARHLVPPGKKRDVAVMHRIEPPGTDVTVVSLRNAMFMGMQPTKIRFDKPLLIQQLKYKGGTWMTDSPQEVYQMDKPLRKMKGTVLVGGLGLGTFSTLCRRLCSDVDMVVSIEKDPKIASLVGPHTPSGLVVADLFEYLTCIKPNQYDSAFFDIWQLTGEWTWRSYVVPLRRLARNKIKTVLCWNEEEMHGQLRQALPIVASLDNCTVSDYYEVFREYCQTKGLTKPEIQKAPAHVDRYETLQAVREKNFADYGVMRAMEHYLKPGTDSWEREFGELWDKHVVERLEYSNAKKRKKKRVHRR